MGHRGLGRPEGGVAGSVQICGLALGLRLGLQGGRWEPWTEDGDAWPHQAVGWGEPGVKEKLLKCLAVAPSEKPVLSKSPGLAA